MTSDTLWQDMLEEEFTTRVVIPLLENMEFMEVTYNHGIGEFGKDILFSEYDRFGNKRYHAAQVKAVDIRGGVKSEINQLVNHAQNAFNIQFDDLITKVPTSICDFFIITSRKFVGQAKTQLLNDARLQQHKHRMHFYEGQHVKELLSRSYKNIQELYVAQLFELSRNNQLASLLISDFTKNGKKVIFYSYLDSNLSVLINKLAGISEGLQLLEKLQLYQVAVARDKNVISALPAMAVLRGTEPEAKILVESAQTNIIRMGDELSAQITEALREHRALST